MGCGLTFTNVTLGAAPVTAPVGSVGYTAWDIKTFQACPDWLLGSALKFDPYHTASARPAPPALIHGKTLTASPVTVDLSLSGAAAVRAQRPRDEQVAGDVHGQHREKCAR